MQWNCLFRQNAARLSHRTVPPDSETVTSPACGGTGAERPLGLGGESDTGTNHASLCLIVTAGTTPRLRAADAAYGTHPGDQPSTGPP